MYNDVREVFRAMFAILSKDTDHDKINPKDPQKFWNQLAEYFTAE
jgi:hypothetical protein